MIDIGCGQDEFIEQLRVKGIQGVGYEPVLRNPKRYLHSQFWSMKEPPVDLYVLRRVSPHIQRPWEFLGEIAESAPRALVLVEFQRLEWLIDNKIWYQLSHDQINLFSIEDFTSRYKVHESGTFSNGEWDWVLLDPSKYYSPNYQEFKNEHGVMELFETRSHALQQIAEDKRPIAILGAVGKGIVLAHGLKLNLSVPLIAIDADFHRWSKYLECSGVEILSPAKFKEHSSKDMLTLVSNPNHLNQVQEYLGNRFDVGIPSKFTS